MPPGAGHYESFYLKASDPERTRGVWVRYTVLKRPGSSPRGSLWCTLWRDAGPPKASKVTHAGDELSSDPGELIRIGASRLIPGRATGITDGARWDLTYTGAKPAFPYLPREVMYRAPMPRTKAVSLHPLATFHGQVTVGGVTLEIDGWPGMIGHNWGREHAERWIWLHGAGFPDAPGAWFDAIIGRIRLGRAVLPWIANGALHLDGRLHRLGGPAAIRTTSVRESATSCTFALPGRGLSVRGAVSARDEQAVAWRYSDPGGGEHTAVNCSVASLKLTVLPASGEERVLSLPAGAAYELGAREAPPGIRVQVFPEC